MSRFTLSILFIFATVSLSGQSISVTFSGTGAAAQIDNVTATNMRTGQSVTLPGTETLVLTAITGIPLVSELSNRVMVFPNPFYGKATLVMVAQGAEQVNLKIQNLVGQVVAELNSYVQPGENEFTFSVNGAGIYVVSINTEEGAASYKAICTHANTQVSSIQYLGSGSDPGNNSGIALKSSQTTYTLGYKAGDIILYRCKSGYFTTVLADSPVSSKNYTVEFVDCTDQDNKNYPAVKIGDQIWMAENLALLPNVHASSAGSETTPYYYVYGYEGTSVSQAKAAANYATYGVLYNWIAARTVCPTGWHLPTDAEWTHLTDYLGASAGGKMKETGTNHWSGANAGATNASGFTVLPGGARQGNGGFIDLGNKDNFWSSTGNGTVNAWYRGLESGSGVVSRNNSARTGGYSVRCLLGAVEPDVTTGDISAIAETSAACWGEVTYDGGATVTVRGVCWNVSGAPTISNPKTTNGSGTGSFVSSLTGLTAGTPYYVRAYATNTAGTAYGEEKQFTTSQAVVLPTVTTAVVTDITQTTASAGGNVTADGGGTVTARGVCWNTGGTPTIANSKTTDGSGTGSFTSSLAGMTSGTPYYVRAYATNSAGTSYGEEKHFTTSQAVVLPSVTTADISSIAETTATGGGNVTADGGATVTAKGICWNTGGAPTTANSKTTDGTGTGSFTSSLAGLTANTPYYVRAYATTSSGTAYGAEKQFTTTGGGGGDNTTDSRDGHVYKTVLIGSQTWFAEDAAYLPAISPSTVGSETVPYYYVYDYEGNSITEAKATSNFSTYGALYNWPAALTACPSGWHLPTDDDWKTLELNQGMSATDVNTTAWRYSGTVGGKLKEAGTAHWSDPNTGATNSSGFTALSCGYRSDPGGFYAMGEYLNLWTASEADAPYAWYRTMAYVEDGVSRGYNSKYYGFPVRCVKD